MESEAWRLNEQCVLGSMLLSRAACVESAELISSEMFRNPAHGILFQRIQAISVTGDPDVVLLKTNLERANQLAEVGGIDYILQVAEAVPSAANIKGYAMALREDYALRSISGELKAAMALDTIKARIAAINESSSNWRAFLETSDTASASISDIFQDIDDILIAHMEGKGNEGNQYSTGFVSLDNWFGGFFEGWLYILGGYSGQGKTALGMEMVYRSAAKGMPWLVVSMEMPARELGYRFVTTRTGISVTAQRTGKFQDGTPLTSEHYEKISEAFELFYNAPIYVIDKRSSLATIKREIKRIRQKHGKIGGVMVDFIQNMAVSSRNRAADIGEIAYKLKDMAKEERCSVVALAQLSRASQTDTKRPELYHLKESGDIENAADVVMLLHRKEQDLAKKEGRREQPSDVDCHVDKFRFGPVGTVKLRFIPSQGLYTE